MDVDDELSWFIVDYLGDNVELLYEKSVSRIWKEISCEIKVIWPTHSCTT